MKRRLTHCLTALSLVLGAAVCVLWMRSLVRADMAGWMTYEGGHYDGHLCERWAESNLGEIVFSRNERWFHYTGGPPSEYLPRPLGWSSHPADGRRKVRHAAAVQRPNGVSFAGFAAGRYDRQSTGTRGEWARDDQSILSVPHWFVAAALLTPAAVRGRQVVRAARRRRREMRGCCGACGYDLRGTTGRCPECGTHTPATLENAPQCDVANPTLVNPARSAAS